MQTEYDEKTVLREYVLEHFMSLMTMNERLGFKAVHVDAKASESSPKMAQMLRGRWGSEDNAEVRAALGEGPERFKDAVFERLMSEHEDEIVINRCPQCNRICRTPRAKQCRWCFHDWH